MGKEINAILGCLHFNIIEQDKFHAPLIWSMKKVS